MLYPSAMAKCVTTGLGLLIVRLGRDIRRRVVGRRERVQIFLSERFHVPLSRFAPATLGSGGAAHRGMACTPPESGDGPPASSNRRRRGR